MATFAYINIGQFPNDQTGDTIRTAFQKVNQNNSNLAIIAGVLGNVAYSNVLANANVIAVPNSLVIRDSNANGYFSNVTANGLFSTNLIRVNNNYYLPTGAAAMGQSIISYGNGACYWGTIESGSAPGTEGDILYNHSGIISAATSVTTDGTNFVVAGNINASGGQVIGPPAIIAANSTPVLNLSNSIVQMVSLTANVNFGGASIVSPSDGREYTFIIIQPSGGGKSWIWPNNFLGGGNIGSSYYNANPNTYGCQKFVYSQHYNNFYATSPLINTN